MNQDPSHNEKLRALIAGYSEKAATAYSQAAPEVLPFLSHETATRWAELGCVLAQASATAAVKYFRESPDLIRAFLNKADLQPSLEIGLGLASRDYGIALEFFRQCPQVLPKIGLQGLQAWAQIAADIAGQDYSTAIEFLKASFQILDQLDIAHLSSWATVGLALALEDRKNKDFMALEYFRISPELLGQVRTREVRPVLLEIALPLAKTSSKRVMEFLRHCPAVLEIAKGLPFQEAVLEVAKTLATTAPTTLPLFIAHSVEALTLAEWSLTQFQQWAQKGIEMARANPERAGAYFSLKLEISHQTLKRLSHGVFLKDISRMLRFYAEGLCGKPVEIMAGVGSPTTPEGIMTLPEKISFFTNPEDNFRFYKVMTFHEAGHLEFKSYDPISPPVLSEIEEEMKSCLALPAPARPAGGGQAGGRQALLPHPPKGSRINVQDLLVQLPDTALAKSLWMIVEEGRIDYLLRHEYPGIQKDMDFVIAQQMKGRPAIGELPTRQAILEALLQLSVADTAEVPLGIAEIVSQGYAILKTVQHPTATVEDSLKAVFRLYLLITRHLEGLGEEEASEKEPKREVSPSEAMGTGHSPVNNLSYRNPLDLQRTGPPPPPRSSQGQSPPPMLKETSAPQDPEKTLPPKQSPETPSAPGQRQGGEGNVYYYDEWEAASGDYKPHWCRLEERPLEGAGGEVANRIQSEYGAMISLLRRYFEYLRPQAFKKVKKQEYGEEIDLESAIESHVERRAGQSPSDRVYSLRQKKTRDVSVAFLIDMSGSTSQQIEMEERRREAKRVIDVEKEGLILLAEALSAIGDEFAMYGFSGYSRNQVNFYLIKDFEERYGDITRQRIGAIKPQGQNRDGTAIRHTIAKLLSRPSRIKLLILLSDGKPLDEDYKGLHALEDTRMALREARAQGIHPFCITVDRNTTEYIQEMYDQVSYTIISNIWTLPQRLPRIYKQLTT